MRQNSSSIWEKTGIPKPIFWINISAGVLWVAVCYLVTFLVIVPDLSNAPGSAGAWMMFFILLFLLGGSFIPFLLLNLILTFTIGKRYFAAGHRTAPMMKGTGVSYGLTIVLGIVLPLAALRLFSFVWAQKIRIFGI